MKLQLIAIASWRKEREILLPQSIRQTSPCLTGLSGYDNVIICVSGYPQQSDDNDNSRLALLAAALRRSQSTGDLDDKSDEDPDYHPIIDSDHQHHCDDRPEADQNIAINQTDPWRFYSADVEDGQETPSEAMSRSWNKIPMLSTNENSGLTSKTATTG